MFKSRRSTAAGMDQDPAPQSQRKQSITTAKVRTQSASGPPIQQTVKVAVIPPRLPPNMAPPTGIGASDCFSWNEPINWQHNLTIEQAEAAKKKKKFGFTTQRTKTNPDLPNFTFREVPYDVWRKHYAKDKDGYYHGTHAPAEDCILNPDDVLKWRLEEPKTVADRFTRGRDILPVYSEAQMESEVPAYTDVADGDENPARASSLMPPESSNRPESTNRSSSFTADGKTTEQIVREAKERASIKKPRKEQLRDALRSGVNMTMGS